MNTFKKLIVVNLLWLCSCTYTQSYQPDFSDKSTGVLIEIKGNYGFENIKFLAKKQSGSGGKHSTLTVKFVNGKNIPADTGKMTELAKQLGTQIKAIIKDPKEFESYIILFDTVTEKGAVTNENYVGHQFSSDEL